MPGIFARAKMVYKEGTKFLHLPAASSYVALDSLSLLGNHIETHLVRPTQTGQGNWLLPRSPAAEGEGWRIPKAN
jgi:hypothetical protein